MKRQYWMADEDEFLNVARKVGTLAELTLRWRGHSCVERFLEGWEVIFARKTYALEGEKTSERQMTNFMHALKHLNGINGRLMSDDLKTIHGIMMDREPVLVGEFRKTRAFAGYHEFHPPFTISREVREALDRYYSGEKAVRLFMDLISIHPFEDGNGRLCRLLLSRALMENGLSLFPVLLSSFHRRGRRHVIQAIKKFDYRPSLFYTLVCKSLVEVWEKFEKSLDPLILVGSA